MARNIRQRWYSAQGQCQIHSSALQQSSGTRRLISLLVLLGMVLILIQQTSDVKKVEKVATAIGLLPIQDSLSRSQSSSPTSLAPTTLRENSSTPDDSVLEEVALEAANPTVRVYQQVWASLLKKAPVSVVAAMSRKLFRRPSSDENEILPEIPWSGVPEWYDASSIQLAQWDEIERANATGQSALEPKSPIPLFMEAFQKHDGWFAYSVSSESEVSQESFFRGLRIALDERLLEQIVDNSPWWSTDWFPFTRSWQRTETLRELIASRVALPQHFTRLDASQLQMSGHGHRGRPIRFDGTVYQVDDSASIAETGFANFEYRAFWLRPDDTSGQPIKVYARAENIDGNVKLAKDSHVSLVGFFFKKIAYKSQRGQEFSPLLLAAYVAPFGLADTADAGDPFLKIQQSSPRDQKWQPPVDTNNALSIVRPSMEKAFGSMDGQALVDAFQGANASLAMKPILELERLAPEFDLLLKQRSHWPVADSVAVIQFAGIATKAEIIRIDSNLAAVREVPYLYRLQIESDGTPIQLLCSTIPNDWLHPDGSVLKPLQQPCVVNGVLSTQSDGSRLAWSRTIQWKRTDASKVIDASLLRPELSESAVFLMDHGWDLAWRDQVGELQKDSIKPLSAKEIEPFYRLMQIAKRAPFIASKSVAESETTDRSIVKLLDALTLKNKKVKPVVERVSMNMRIVRVSSVRVEDPAQAAMLGSDRYYQLDGMADIGNRAYEDLGDKSSAGNKVPILHHKEYPVTCVCLELPPWLISDAQDPKGNSRSDSEAVWYPRIKSSVSGWFFRFWSYKTQETAQSLGENHRQIGPLVVLDSLTLGINTNDSDSSGGTNANTANTLTMLIGVAGALGIWWFVRTKARPKLRSLKSRA